MRRVPTANGRFHPGFFVDVEDDDSRPRLRHGQPHPRVVEDAVEAGDETDLVDFARMAKQNQLNHPAQRVPDDVCFKTAPSTYSGDEKLSARGRRRYQ